MLTETRSLVCVIDDDAMVRESICLLLDMLGLQCTAFADCRSFLDSPTLPHCECLILDVRMPGISGTDVCRLLRQDAACAGLFVVAYTAHALVSERHDILAAGFDELLIKPINRQRLLSVLKLPV